ncbi:DNA-formamidopyrimidine glycosylase [Mycoplasma crocodyli]|uniref:DNA-formamidopyrimidine glycosylase n=1 Tax=Mycoplasma crocodyli (strain ATCC 51981 / MP145) TaxID=512564 RepID=D5E549_MYCCM|nr:DNA-formamidopyrimidine glycosylase [Mycoplasma crocodyli]ADE19499.1 DNA-formamidopyrimidine glycosylase [Mycoplasma crocodyli MP145]
MPEYPEVTVVTNALNEIVKFKKIKEVIVNLDKIIKNVDVEKFKNTLKDKVIFSIENIGKYIVIKFESDWSIIAHMRMEGKFFYETNNFLRNKKHDLIIFVFDDGNKLIYNDTRRFGTMDLHYGDVNNFPKISKLGNLPNQLDASKIMDKCKRKTTAIKTTLLDQELVLGIGNIYADEILYASKINPLTKAKDISLNQWKTILNFGHTIMTRSIELGGSTVNSYSSINNKEGSYQNELKVYGKYKEFCTTCKSQFEKIKVNGRGTTYCPKCQKTR